MIDDVITTAKAAQLIGISREAVIQAIWKGDIHAQKLGRDWVVNKQSALDYKERRDSNPTGKYRRK